MSSASLLLLTTVQSDEVRRLQEKLNRLLECVQGFNKIKVDGRVTPATIDGIRLLQRTIGLQPTGLLPPGSPEWLVLGKPNIPIVNPQAACEMAREERFRDEIVARLHIVERSVWAATETATALPNDWNYDGIAIHHAGNSYSCSATGVGEMQRLQVDERARGFADVGYHYAIACSGTVFEGRDLRRKGEHVAKQNTGLIGIVLLADFTARGEGARFGKNETRFGRLRDQLDFSHEDKVPDPQLKSLTDLIQTLRRYFDITTLGGHREFAARLGDERSCPGDIVLSLIQNLRTRYGLSAPKP
jgi:hypothetical protein